MALMGYSRNTALVASQMLLLGRFLSSEGFSQAILLSGGLSPALFCSYSAASLTAQGF